MRARQARSNVCRSLREIAADGIAGRACVPDSTAHASARCPLTQPSPRRQVAVVLLPSPTAFMRQSICSKLRCSAPGTISSGVSCARRRQRGQVAVRAERMQRQRHRLMRGRVVQLADDHPPVLDEGMAGVVLRLADAPECDRWRRGGGRRRAERQDPLQPVVLLTLVETQLVAVVAGRRVSREHHEHILPGEGRRTARRDAELLAVGRVVAELGDLIGDRRRLRQPRLCAYA